MIIDCYGATSSSWKIHGILQTPLRANLDWHLQNGNFCERKMEKSDLTVDVPERTVVNPPQKFTGYGKSTTSKLHALATEVFPSQDSIKVWVVGSTWYAVSSYLCWSPRMSMCSGNGIEWYRWLRWLQKLQMNLAWHNFTRPWGNTGGICVCVSLLILYQLTTTAFNLSHAVTYTIPISKNSNWFRFSSESVTTY